MTTLDLQAIELIKRLKYRYCNAIDTCDTDALEKIFAEDATIDYHGGSYRFQASSRVEIITAIKAAFHEEFVGCHSVIHPIIDVADDGTAVGQWRLVDYAMNLREDNLVTIGAATYTDQYVKVNDDWRIQKSAYTRIYERCYHEAEPGLTHFILGGGHQ